MAVFLSVITAFLYGSGDFLGGVSSRRHPAIQVLITVSLVGALPLLVIAPFIATRANVNDLVLGAVAGLAGMAGLGLLYRGLARGPMAIFAPITAIVSALFPIIWGLYRGDEQGLQIWFGVAIGIIGIFILSSHPTGENVRVSISVIYEALLAGLGFGLFFSLLSETSTESAPWPIVTGRFSAALVLICVALTRRVQLRPSSGWIPLIGCGICDTGANVAFLFALRYGQLGPVAVLASLYPAVTVVLARIVLGEQLTKRRLVGLAFAMSTVVLIGLS